MQTVLSLCIALSFFYIGMIRGYSAPAVPSILENNPEILPTKNIASWASSIPPAGACIGSILAAFSLRLLGRKYTIIVASPLATIGWILIATASNYWVIIAARFLNGFCVGLCLPAAQVYVGNFAWINTFGSFWFVFRHFCIISDWRKCWSENSWYFGIDAVNFHVIRHRDYVHFGQFSAMGYASLVLHIHVRWVDFCRIFIGDEFSSVG